MALYFFSLFTTSIYYSEAETVSYTTLSYTILFYMQKENLNLSEHIPGMGECVRSCSNKQLFKFTSAFTFFADLSHKRKISDL